MATETEQLVVSLEARVNQFEKSFRSANRTASTNWTAIEARGRQAGTRMRADMDRAAAGVLTSMRSMGSRLAGSLGLGAGFAGVVATMRGAASSLAEIRAQAQRAGLASEVFQELAYAAGQSRVPVDAIVDGFKELQMRSDEFIATAGGPAADAFRRIGLSPEELKTRLADPAALLEEIIRRVQTLDKAAQIRIFDELFGGTGGERFTRFLERGADNVARLRREAVETGNVLGDDVLRKAEDVDAAFNRMVGTVGTQLKGAIVEAASALAGFLDTFNSLESRTNIAGLSTTLSDIYGRRDEINQRIEDLRAGKSQLPGLMGSVRSEEMIAELEAERLRLNNDASGVLNRIGELNAANRPTTPPVELAPIEVVGTGGGGGGGGGGAGGRAAARSFTNAYAELRRSAQERIADLQVERDVIGMTTEAAASYRLEAEMLAEVQRNGLSLTDQQRQELSGLAATYGALTGEVERAQAAQERLKDTADAFKDTAGEVMRGFIGDLRQGISLSEALSNVLDRLVDRLLDMAIDGLLNAAFGGGIFSAGLFGFGGARATGGPVDPGRAYVIGERGPELFVPRHGGTIIPNGAVVAKGGPTQNINIAPVINMNAPGGSPDQNADLANKTAKAVTDSMRQIVAEELRTQMRPGGMLNPM